MILAILASLIFWPLYLVLNLVLDALGLVLIPLLLATKQIEVRLSKVWPMPTRIGGERKGGLQAQWKPKWAYIWCNEEDGVVGPLWFSTRHPGWSDARIAFYWSALRNPSNNLRFVSFINPVIDPARVDYVALPLNGFFTWQGLYAGILLFPKFGEKTFRFWLGWKLKPEDVNGVADDDMRKPRCGWATQFKRVG